MSACGPNYISAFFTNYALLLLRTLLYANLVQLLRSKLHPEAIFIVLCALECFKLSDLLKQKQLHTHIRETPNRPDFAKEDFV